jgi:hypothetical protein
MILKREKEMKEFKGNHEKALRNNDTSRLL